MIWTDLPKIQLSELFLILCWRNHSKTNFQKYLSAVHYAVCNNISRCT